MLRWFYNIAHFKRSEEGVAFVEFALSIPFLLALLMGAVELTRYILIEQKVEKAAATISDVVAQGTTVSQSDLSNIIIAATQVMKPFTFGPNGYVIITSVTQTGTQSASNPPIVNWQYAGGGSMLPAPASVIGTPGNAANLPTGFTMANLDNVIVTEVFYNYTPLLVNNGVMNGAQIYKFGLYKPRLGALNTLLSWQINPVSRVSGCTGSIIECRQYPAQSQMRFAGFMGEML